MKNKLVALILNMFSYVASTLSKIRETKSLYGIGLLIFFIFKVPVSSPTKGTFLLKEKDKNEKHISKRLNKINFLLKVIKKINVYIINF